MITKGRYQRDLSSATITENRPLPETPHRHLLACSAVNLSSPMASESLRLEMGGGESTMILSTDMLP
jgi:hypothetical protein